MSPFPILGLLGSYFHFKSNLNKILFANSGQPGQMPHFAVSDLVRHYLPKSHIKDTRLIWVSAFKTLCMLGYFACFFCRLLISPQNQCFLKFLTGI